MLLQRLPKSVFFFLFVGIMPFATSSATFTHYKISGHMPEFGDIHFSDFAISNDNQYVVYIADQDEDETKELYSTHLDGSTLPIKLNADLPFGTAVDRFEISNNGRFVVYALLHEITDMYQLFSVPIGGGDVIQLSEPIVGSCCSHIRTLHISSDSSWVVYLTHKDSEDPDKLFSTPIDGGETVNLNGTVARDITFSRFQIAPDGSRVVFSSNQRNRGEVELFSVPIQGGAVQVLSDTNGIFMDLIFGIFQISPDSKTVVYLSAQETRGVRELFSVPIDGGTSIKLNNPFMEERDISHGHGIIISPDSKHVVFVADQDTDEVWELFSVPIKGGTVQKLNDPFVPEGDIRYFATAPNSSRVVYTADQEVDGQEELFSVPITGGKVEKLDIIGNKNRGD